MFWTSVKRWWRNHKWVDVSKNYVLPRENETFWLNRHEMRTLTKYKKDYHCRCVRYLFVPSGIGTSIYIKGDPIGPELDITDYSAW